MINLKPLYKIIVLLSITGLILGSVNLFAGTTGKIAGTVRDSQNGAPLPGVNVYLEGTNLGAATDADGFFYIINIQPGTYTLKINYIGYADYQINDVMVQIDLTTRLNIELTAEILEGETVVIVAERPVVVQDVSNSQLNIVAQEVESLPVHSVTEALTLQAGIQSGSRGLIVRGGSENQTVFMVDGLSQNDERSNYPYTAISRSSVEEIQVQTGGFSAEYGQVRSGLVNVITKEGKPNKYTATLTFEISPPASKHFGPSLYDRMSYFNRPYFDPEVMWTGTDNGAWDSHTRAQYPNFEGWIAVSEALLADENPDNDLTPEGAMRLFQWYRRRQGDIKKPDYVADFGLGGPVPFISDELGNLRFYASHVREQEMFVFPLSRDHYGSQHTQLKLTSDISPSMKLLVDGFYGEIHSVSPYNWTTTPTGYVLRDQEDIADLTNYSDTGTSIPYMPGFFSPSSIYRSMFGIKFIHTLSPNTLYEVRFQYKKTKNHTFKTEDRDLNKRYEIIPGFFVDEAPYGYYGATIVGIANAHLGGWMNLGRDESENMTRTFAADLTSQIDNRNQIKTGFEFVHNDYNIKSFTESPTMDTWNRSLVYQVFPYRLGLYMQDKLEFEGFIANAGVRLDYTNPNSESFVLGQFDDFYKAGFGSEIEEGAPVQDAQDHLYISPRLGISHPISENSKLYFNYGHFVSEPSSSYRFRIQRENRGDVTYMGNPNLEFERTISYEVGYEHDLYDMVLLKVAGYYKDAKNQPGWVYYHDLNGDVKYYRMENNNYADIRGVEFTLHKRYGNYINGFINYTYDVRTSGYFGLLENWQNPQSQRLYLEEKPEQFRPHARPYARANINIFTPYEFGPKYLNQYPLGGWNLNIIADWITGRYETYNPTNQPDVVDNVQWRDWYNVNLRLSKMFAFGDIDVYLYVDIINLLNFKYMGEAGFSDKNDRLDYLESLRFSWENGLEKGDDRVGDYRPAGVPYEALEPNPTNDPEIKKRNDWRIENKSYIDMPNIKSLTFLNPRDVYFGIRINF